ncbi:MAG: glycosyltransferase family 4 protein [Phaeodactylibacter sp.]|nr:glycosyltransferase family 4 protein [Phaeodactylibacter sp.]MCB9294279.1 glycosyltransferase family 4 protein [Lewinellaceae bacterium]
MTLALDASNIRAGGGLAHLQELIAHAEPEQFGFKRVILWAPASTLEKIPDRPWLAKDEQPLLNRGLPWRMYWVWRHLPRLARKHSDILFGLCANPVDFHPYVTICQNQLPFAPKERRRYGWSAMRLRLEVLSQTQKKAFREADGVIFLSQASQEEIRQQVATLQDKPTRVVPHGLNRRFETLSKVGEEESKSSFRLLYVSIIDVYKHQWHLAEAVLQLAAEGLPVALDLIGPAYPPALRRLRAALARYPKQPAVVQYHGAVPYEDIHRFYQQADMLAFASSCETFGMILLEAMASGKPVLASDIPVNREHLGASGFYFDPEDVSSIKRAIRAVLTNREAAREKGRQAQERARAFTWERTAAETFAFLEEISADFR